MKLRQALLSLSLGTCLLGGTTGVRAQPPDAPPLIFDEPAVALPNASPNTVIEYFVRFYNSSQWDKLPELIIGVEADDAARNEIVEAIAKARGTLRLRVTDIEFEMAGDDVSAMLTVHALDDLGMGMAWRETLKVQRRIEKGLELWYLRPGEPRLIDRSAFDGYLQRLITLIAFPKKALGLQRERGPRQSAMQVKQLTLGVKQFLQDHDEQYAFTTETIKNRILPYIRSEELWTAPGDAAGTVSYSFNPHLSNANEADILHIAETVLFYLGKDEKLDFRYDGKTVIGFTDGHVELLTEEQAKKLRWEP